MKNRSKILSLQLAGLMTFSLVVRAATVPPPEKLLPDDTLALLAIPDYSKAKAAFGDSAGFLLWRDPAMKPFADKLSNKINEQLIQPLERELGVKFTDYAGLLQGEFALAIVQNGWQGKDDKLPAWLLLMDSRSEGM